MALSIMYGCGSRMENVARGAQCCLQGKTCFMPNVPTPAMCGRPCDSGCVGLGPSEAAASVGTQSRGRAFTVLQTRPLIPLHPRWRMAPRMQKAASRGPAQRHNEVSFKIERPERSGPTAPRCAARCAALRPPRWCTPPMRCETCTNAAACVCPGSEVGRRMCDASI